ncbi:hypothetical protein [Bacillus velezensis]|uniref:hypothetical protein n=1 Tax=Bacillus velezensis TaxID=492670 RepID=UPI002DBCF0C8|nr:hypothetical protein [Bacillus velezensis]MEC2215064.1 hypothetical protein [Bacillus velezensis]
MTENNAKIHVLADETLGGIKREYVEVDREVENGDTVLVTKMDGKDVRQIAKVIDIDFDGNSSYETLRLDRNINGEDLVNMLYNSEDEFVLLEPTDIVHIDGRRYEMIDREAEVGEKIIHLYEGESNGIAREVRKTDDEGVEVDPYEDEEGVWIGLDHGYYRVLVPVEAAEDEPKPADPIDVIASLAQEVAELKKAAVHSKGQTRALADIQETEAKDLRKKIAKLQDEIDTLHKDSRTLGEELARLKQDGNTQQPTGTSFADFCEGYIAYSKAMKEVQQ